MLHKINAEVLLDNGANVNLQDSINGWTPLILAVAFGRLELVQLFLKNGANVTTADKNGDTALTYAIRGNHVNHVNIATILKGYFKSETTLPTQSTLSTDKYRPERDALKFAALFPTLEYHGYT